VRFRRRKNHELQGVIHLYREQTGETDVDLRKVAEFALSRLRWRMPPPLSAAERLAKDLASAAREETRYDPVTRLPYRVNHSYPGTRDGEPRTLWTDIDRAPRGPMQMSLQLRRKGMVDDGYHLALDVDHWNRKNPEAEPIVMVFDLTSDVEERKNAPNYESNAS
jgi:hypothetical protein